MKVYLKQHNFGAGAWIYKGFFSAWKNLGYEPVFYENLYRIKQLEKDYYLMVNDADINSNNLYAVKNSTKSFVFTQPNSFPFPWGNHPNFISLCPPEIIPILNQLPNVKQWTFGKVTKFHYLWNKPSTVLLAFDSINYTKKNIIHNYNFDVCFIGGRANNGFDEKIKIINEFYSHLEKTKLKYGFFVDKNLSHEEECSLFYTSKIAINLHDNYQRQLGLDINERTFKALGMTGILVSDNVKVMKDIFPQVPLGSTSEEMISHIQQILSLTEQERRDIKESNIELVLKEHTYVNRVQQMLNL